MRNHSPHNEHEKIVVKAKELKKQIEHNDKKLRDKTELLNHVELVISKTKSLTDYLNEK